VLSQSEIEKAFETAKRLQPDGEQVIDLLEAEFELYRAAPLALLGVVTSDSSSFVHVLPTDDEDEDENATIAASKWKLTVGGVQFELHEIETKQDMANAVFSLIDVPLEVRGNAAHRALFVWQTRE
jgi:hypothetical protein